LNAPVAHRPRDLFSQQESNRRKSSWLLLGFVFFFAWIGFGGDIGLYLLQSGATSGYHHTIPWLGILATAGAAAMAWAAWRHGDRQVLWSTRAMELINPVTDEQVRLVNVATEMSIASGLPMPRLWIVPDSDPNAFATGRDPQSASIAVTEGLLETLDRDELQAVLAHEFAHIARYDTRLMTLVAAIVGAITLLSDGVGRILFQSRRVGGRAAGFGGGGRRGGGGRSAAGALVIVVWLLTLIVAPLVSRMLAMAISRKREFLADATAAQYTRNPAALISALEKCENARGPTLSVGRGAAHLCIVDPADRRFQKYKGLIGDVMASHPSLQERVLRLRQMMGSVAAAA
jgi:heat shock protein HtpX